MDHQDKPVPRHAPSAIQVAACAALWILAGLADGQTIYRIVGSDGKVTFSDKPPITADSATVHVGSGKNLSAEAALLPSELRQIVGKYPVMLYTSSGCAPCNSGRELLGNRGIPFSEKTVSSAEDGEALQRISGGTSLPFLTIGKQQIKGFSEPEWTQFLDAAGYPKTSVLPASYRAPPPTPLNVVQKAEPAAKPDESQPLQVPSEPTQAPSNPGGIRF